MNSPSQEAGTANCQIFETGVAAAASSQVPTQESSAIASVKRAGAQDPDEELLGRSAVQTIIVRRYETLIAATPASGSFRAVVSASILTAAVVRIKK